jgi:hypothetical protein
LKGDVESDLASADAKKRLVTLDEAVLALKEDEFVEDAVAFDGTPLYRGRVVSTYMDKKGEGERTPTTKKTPANRAAGMVCKTLRRGPVMVPIKASPMTKCEMRCSTTAVARTMPRRISVSSPSDVGITFSSVS